MAAGAADRGPRQACDGGWCAQRQDNPDFAANMKIVRTSPGAVVPILAAGLLLLALVAAQSPMPWASSGARAADAVTAGAETAPAAAGADALDLRMPIIEPERDPEPPPGVDFYMGREVAQTMHWMGAAWLIRTRREREESAGEMREQLNLEPGMVVCDMGSGNGYHTIPMARAVGPEGRVVAVEIQRPMLEMLRESAVANEVDNIDLLLGELHDPHLEEGSLDMLVMVDVYHEFSHPEHMLAGIRRAMKPDGQVVLVEYRAEDPTVPIRPEHKMEKEQVILELEANGFQLERSYDELPWQHMLFFKVDPDAEVPPPGERGENPVD